MDRVVVDATVLFAALMSDGRARHVLLHSPKVLYVPPFVFEEVDAHMAEIVATSGLPRAVVEAVLADLEDRVEVVPPALVAPFLDEARELCGEADAEGDEDHVALALALDAPVWTYDDDFGRVEDVGTIGTAEVAGEVAGEEDRKAPGDGDA